MDSANPNADRLQRWELTHSRFRDGLVQHFEEWASKQLPDPNRLYHYTTLEGMRGIVETECIWLSDARYMNDASELEYAIGLIEDEVSAVIRGSDLQEIVPPEFRLEMYESPVGAKPRPFIACFCEVDDLLSQWRGYGDLDASVALGLQTPFRRPAQLRRVIYDEQQQRELVRNATLTWAQILRVLVGEGEDPRELVRMPARWALEEVLAEYYLCFKHPAFSEEREWRLIWLLEPRAQIALARHGDMVASPPTGAHFRVPRGVEILFRRSAYGLTPFIKAPLSDSPEVHGGQLPLVSVSQGPRAHASIALESLALYLEAQGYGLGTELRASTVPLRR